ncbi:hypothetical protein CN488_18075 [Bacillus anthracis]|nr:hypothetical protein CN488_18075 [Bacillus anthracis]PGR20661.1 hypothetical protein COC50_19720 [Bacillus anthracis]
MPTFLSIISFEPRIVPYLVSYLVSLMGMRQDPLYGILYNTILKLNMPKWTAHMVATLFSLGSAHQAFVNFFV